MEGNPSQTMGFKIHFSPDLSSNIPISVEFSSEIPSKLLLLPDLSGNYRASIGLDTTPPQTAQGRAIGVSFAHFYLVHLNTTAREWLHR
jgi:hypothetical protein